ncbi:hypothetical protein CBR_g34384 [Chara braunii]|uniref:DDE Tnp4 domain-containing protein n=1 Tax=Chara braunii TaxID=69332 RepID=A0A388LIE7_CHABU|nr:hypothetical protein CBR_g34384 [Chara braunii]|eukprot:GBG82104.1 hypothetical protein CBR_g34384 [Chara braunii]
MEISEACAPHVERQVTFYREPLQPEQIVAYALYRWATGESYDNSTSSFGMGRTSGVRIVRDVTAAILRVYGEKISWPTGVQKQVVVRFFLDKCFPNCHAAVDDTHIYVDKPANAPSENYFDHKDRFSVIAQVVVDLDLRVLDVFVGYPGSCHDISVIQLSSLSRRAEEGLLFRGPPVTLPGGVTTNGYILGDNRYPPSEWVVVPYGGINQHPNEERFDTKQKVARGAIERAFERLKGMWRLFLRTHKTNLESLPQQFTAVFILHNIVLDAGIEFDENLLWEVDANGVQSVAQRSSGPCRPQLGNDEHVDEGARRRRSALTKEHVEARRLEIDDGHVDEGARGRCAVVVGRSRDKDGHRKKSTCLRRVRGDCTQCRKLESEGAKGGKCWLAATNQ